MTNLAIECSGTAGSVGLFDGETPISYSDLDASLSSVRTLASQIERTMRGLPQPRLISVTNGPGSFTGLRVGLTTAKMLAMAWKVPVVPVDTLHAIALRAHRTSPSTNSTEPVVAVLNAFRGQVFAATIRFLDQNVPEVLLPSYVVDAQVWCNDPSGGLSNIQAGNKILVSGPGLKNYAIANDNVNGIAFQVVSPDVWNPTAVEVAHLGELGLASGRACDAFTLEPNYIRASAAEEKTKRTTL